MKKKQILWLSVFLLFCSAQCAYAEAGLEDENTANKKRGCWPCETTRPDAGQGAKPEPESSFRPRYESTDRRYPPDARGDKPNFPPDVKSQPDTGGNGVPCQGCNPNPPDAKRQLPEKTVVPETPSTVDTNKTIGDSAIQIDQGRVVRIGGCACNSQTESAPSLLLFSFFVFVFFALKRKQATRK